MPWFDILTSNFENWLSRPIPSIFALLLGIYIGFLVSRLRHQGRIDALEERVKHRDDQIKMKDDAIQSLNAQAAVKPKSRGRARTNDSMPASIKAPITPEEPTDDPIWEAEGKILNAVNWTTYKFIFNPVTEQSKILTFLPNGEIGEGRNDNESRWRIANGRLEILDGWGAPYSRFLLMEDGLSFHHTNESDTRSIRGQYMLPIATRPRCTAVHG